MSKKILNTFDTQMERIKENNTDNIQLIEFKKDFYYVPGFGNVGIVMTSEGVVLIDTGINKDHAELIYHEIRERTKLPIRYIIYTHGHMDHVNSADVFKEPGTQVLAHENVIERFNKYVKLREHRTHIGSIQFDDKTTNAKSYDFTYPNLVFEKEFEFSLGNKTFQITHGKGETDDQCFVFIPEDQVVYSGDFFIWAFPNIGNPLKEIRFEREWYESLEKINELQPEFFVPGHGELIVTKDRIQKALQDLIDCLRFVHDEVIRYMNNGKSLEEMLDLIKLPSHLEASEYITQHYGCLMFAIKGTYRRYTGWFDWNPTNLQPEKEKRVASEIVALIKEPSVILDRCKELTAQGEIQMAMHLLDLLILGDSNGEAIKLKKQLTKKLSETNENFIMRNIYKQLANRMEIK